jgi:ribosomal protein L24E
MLNETKTFNGNYIGTAPATYATPVVNDVIEYCCFCGQKLPISTTPILYCPYCGKELPRTYTGSMYVIHWNYGDGTSSYPRDGIIEPNIIC